MTITGYGGICSINGLNATELDVLLAIAYTADKRCFNVQEDNCSWYGNDDLSLH